MQEDAALRRRAEEKLRAEAPALPEGDPRRIMHELQVHQIQLEMQNAELRDARGQLEQLVEKYTDLYDFAPVGYFTLDESSRIREVNLTGAAMLGIERSRLLKRQFSSFVARANRAAFDDFLRDVCAGDGKQVCEAMLENGTGEAMFVDLQGTPATHPEETVPLCRLAVSDTTALKRAEEEQKRAQELKAINEALEDEVARRRKTETSLRKSKRSQGRLLAEARLMQEQLRLLTHKILHVQEAERKRISRDLHDEIAQTLVAVNFHLASLAEDAAAGGSVRMKRKIIKAHKMVEESVESVHRFAMGLRPTELDDLGLTAALRSFTKEFTKQTKLPVHLSTPTDLKPLDDASAVAIYRVMQAALSNVAQHGEATEVNLTIRQTQSSLLMEVTDNGKGFDPKTAHTVKKPNRLGLIGMRERIEMVGGNFTISSSPGKGTTVRVTVPFKDHP